MLNSQSVLESGWFFPLFDGNLIAQPSWALGVLGEEKCEVSACYTNKFASDSGPYLWTHLVSFLCTFTSELEWEISASSDLSALGG